MWCKILIVVLGISLANAETRYDGYKVLRILPKTEFEVRYLRTVQEKGVEIELDFWQEPTTVGKYVDVMLSENQANVFMRTLSSMAMEAKVWIDDVQGIIDEQAASRLERSDALDNFYNVYHTFDEINTWMDTIVTTYPSLASQFTVTTSYEGRKITGLKIGSAGSNKPAVFLCGCEHAREWISTAVMLYTVGLLIDNYGTDPEVTDLMDSVDYYIVPVLNPDGYVWSWTDDRMWRKTRSPNEGSVCVGTDPNRNWGYQWGTGGSSSLPCASTYMGTEPFSEVEVSGTAQFLASMPNIKVFADVHAYSQMWMSPWAYTHDLPADFTEQNRLNQLCAEAIQSVYGTVYEYGTIANVIYVASGSSGDWTYNDLGILYSHAVELRDTGEYGFLLPEDQIEPSGIETFEAFKELGYAAAGA
ncbi:carboxypeptidase B-like [Saccoglossus kowalevskii]|uniref:Carboxypeptidase A2-like n=1 Tax=Saccoglossus kowalevskii TaxID=10224 RepID=A0ABM0LX82_SACKO|nr:PREDICTED: carboxypeptidase A2-like [Saccoglossus kowalevskii]